LSRLIFDIETDGLLESVTKLLCISIRDFDTGEEELFDENFEDALALLSSAETLIGHNICNYDIPVLEKLYQFSYTGTVHDTMLMGRLYWADIENRDYKVTNFPGKLIGKHSLKAWGYRLGVLKGDYFENHDWENAEYTPEMGEYCTQDTLVTQELYKRCLLKLEEWGPRSYDLELAFARIINEQVRFGFPFDVGKGEELYAKLLGRRHELTEQLCAVFPPVDKGDTFIPKANNKTRGYTKGVAVWRPKIVPFNPASRAHIYERLHGKYNWEPDAVTEKGQPKVDETTLSSTDFEETPLLLEYLMLDKRISQLAEGNQAWLKVVKDDGRIHGSVITNGAVTGRCTHFGPNVAQVPANGAPYGVDCRSLFGPPAGYYQLGCDASGLELRCLAHYMARYDDGAYAKVVCEGDVHTLNQQAAGLSTRNAAKTMIYAFLYGAGDLLLGQRCSDEKGLSDDKYKSIGKKIKRQFLAKTPALANLIRDVKSVATNRGFLIGLDGRRLSVRSEHSALNLLLQSAGALIMKQATVNFWNASRSLDWLNHVHPMAHIHDEFQLAVKGLDKELVGQEAIMAIRKAGTDFNFKCPLDGEYKVGSNWAECH
jgi:DNA polymerase I-like protein with 3'-5' exonuclease and polymerase domains